MLISTVRVFPVEERCERENVCDKTKHHFTFIPNFRFPFPYS